jgi:hypothetical protein
MILYNHWGIVKQILCKCGAKDFCKLFIINNFTYFEASDLNLPS